MHWNAQTRAFLVCVVLGAAFSSVSFRLLHVQVTEHERYVAKAAANHLRKVPVTARRGAIRDCRGELLAGNLPVRNVALAGPHFSPASTGADILARRLGLAADGILARIDTADPHIPIKNGISMEEAAALEEELAEAGVSGVIFEQDYRRIYPNGKLLCHALGWYGWTENSDGQTVQTGVHGIERTMEDVLRGRPGYRFIERDGLQREIVPYRGQEQPAIDGADVFLTVDMGMQNIVEEELNRAMERYRPKTAVAIFMRPATGEILAIASRPGFDPALPGEIAEGAELNRAISAVAEPGSTFKIVVAAAALNEKIVDLDTSIYCENGRYEYAGHTLRDHRSYGDLTVRQIVTNSSNIGAAKLAIQLGDQRYYNYVRRFGFGFRTGIELPGEVGGLVHPVDRWSRISIAQLPMGQGIAVTPLQMLAAMNAIANRGHLVGPRIVRAVCAGGEPAGRFEPTEVRQVVSPVAAAQLAAALEEATGEDGTATMAAVPGFRTAGKTGTAQKPDPDNRGYLKGKYLVSFVGYFPATNPKVCGIVVLDECDVPPESNYGGQVAGPVFAAIGSRLAIYMDLTPDAGGLTAAVGAGRIKEPR